MLREPSLPRGKAVRAPGSSAEETEIVNKVGGDECHWMRRQCVFGEKITRWPKAGGG